MARASDEIYVGNNVANGVGGGGGNLNNEAHQRVQEMLEERIQKKEEHIVKMEASVFQLANYYFVFQGVILSAISSSSSVYCKYFWLPFSLSLIGAIFNLGTLFIIAVKYKECLGQLDDRTLIWYQHLNQDGGQMLPEQHRKKKAWRKRMLVLSIVLFCIFAVLNLVATRIIPCHKLF